MTVGPSAQGSCAAFQLGSSAFAPHNETAACASPRRACPWRMMARTPARKQRALAPSAISDAIAKSARMGDISGLDWALRSARQANFALNAVNYTAIASGLARGGEFRRCFETLASMRAAHFIPSNVTLRSATAACLNWAATGKRAQLPATLALEEMVAWFVEAGEPVAEVKSWNMVLAAFSKLESRKRALGILRDMEQRGGKAKNVPKPDIVSYNTCMTAVKGDVEQVQLLFFQLLRNTEVKPDVISYNTLLKIAIEDERIVAALAESHLAGRENIVTGSMLFAKAVLVSMRRQNVPPDVRTWTSMLKLITKNSAETAKVEASMRSSILEIWHLAGNSDQAFAPDLILCNSFVSAFAHVEDAQSAGEVLRYMLKHNISADMYTINSVLGVLSRKGKVDLVLEVLKELRVMSVRPDTYTYIEALTSCSRCTPTRPTVAEKLLQDAVRDRVRIMPAMMNAAISSFGDGVSDALRFWQKMRGSDEQRYRNSVKHVQAYEALFRVCGRAARPDVALKIVYVMRKSKDVEAGTGANLFHSFERGLREGNNQGKVEGLFAKRYLEHFRTECQAFVMNLPVERIRIKF